jgi:hypothetical protein
MAETAAPEGAGVDDVNGARMLSVGEAAKALGIGTRFAYDLVRKGAPPFGENGPIRVVHIGRLVKIPRADVERFLGGFESGVASG